MEEATWALIAETPGGLESPIQNAFMEGSQASSSATAANTSSVVSAGAREMNPTDEEVIQEVMQVLIPQSTQDAANVDDKAATKRPAEEGVDDKPAKKVKQRRGRHDPEPDWSANMRNKQSTSGKNRSRHACDRCRVSPPSLPPILPTSLLTISTVTVQEDTMRDGPQWQPVPGLLARWPRVPRHRPRYQRDIRTRRRWPFPNHNPGSGEAAQRPREFL